MNRPARRGSIGGGLALISVSAALASCAPGPCPPGWERLEANLCGWVGGAVDADDSGAPEDGTLRGDLVVESDADLAGFCASFERIDGALLVRGTDVGSLAALDCLVEVTGDLLIESNPKLEALYLPSLTAVRGALHVNANGSLRDLSLGGLTDVGGDLALDLNEGLAGGALPALTHVGGEVSVYQNAAFLPVPGGGELDLSALVAVDRNLFIRLNNSLTRVDLSSLTDVGGMLKLTGNAILTTLVAPVLEETTGLWISYNAALQTFSLPALHSTGGVTLIRPGLAVLDLPSLEWVHATIEVTDTVALTTLTMPALTAIDGGLWVHDNPGVSALAFPALGSIVGALQVVRNPALPTSQAEALRDVVGVENIGEGVLIEDNADG